MPRQGRIDFPGALHHVIIRGINRAAIFRDDRDRNKFIRLLQEGLGKTKLLCFAWALIPNHVHLLLRTGSHPLTELMRGLLTGYAVYFNRRHDRTGYLFQNRYKSILCDEESYLLQLVRYIHLNPLRAELVADLWELSGFRWCGHSALMGKQKVKWQDTESILLHFGLTVGKARRSYLNFIENGVSEGQRFDLTGGGLIRSVGGWQNLLEMRKAGDRWRGDERILGDNDFVQRALIEAEEQLTKREEKRSAGWNLETLLDYVAEKFGINSQPLKRGKKDQRSSRARALFCWWATEELGYTLTGVADFLSVDKSAVLRAARKGGEIAKERNMQLLGK